MIETLHFSDIRESAIYALKKNGLCVKVSHLSTDTVVGKHWDGTFEQFAPSQLMKADSEQVRTWVHLTRERRDAEYIKDRTSK